MEGWKEYKFGGVVNINSDSITSGYPHKWIKYLDTSSVTDNIFHQPISLELSKAPSRAKRIVKSNSILYSTVRPNLRHFGYIKAASDNLIASTGFAVITGKPITDTRFLFYWLTQESIIKYLTALAEAQTTTFPAINPSEFSDLDIDLPPLPLQHRIAEILGALDDKIELNRQMNQTLEHMAQALYKHYFVDDIDPENLPEGWRNGNVLELADLLSGGTPKTEIQEYWNGGIDWISAKDITPNNKCFIVETGKKISPEGLAKSAAKLLPRYTTVITARGTVGNYCMLSREMAISQSNYGLKSKTGNSDFFIFQLVGNLVDKMKQQAYGTVFDTITTKTFQELEIVIPPKEVIINFENVIKPLFELRLSTTFEVKNLSNIRDYLLPKLISGDFIPSALQTIEQAL